MAYLLSPLYNDAQFDSAGDPLVGGKLYWYQAGTTTPATVYTDATGATSHANPIILNARGEAASPIYLDDSLSYKAVLADADDAVIRTIDGIDGIGTSGGGAVSEWTVFGGAPSYVDADEFSVAGDQTAAFHVGRRVRLTLSGSTLYGTIAASTYASATTVQVTLDSGSLDGTLSSVAYGLASENPAVPNVLGAISFRNKLINGNFAINQRGYVSGAATTGANQYTLDRWRVVTSGQSVTFSASGNGNQVTAPAGGMEQVIEGANIEGGIYTLSWTGTATATVNGDAITNRGQTSSLTAGSDVTIKFVGGTVEEAQFERGRISTPFEQRPIGLELSLCQRYFYQPQGDLPGFVSGTGTEILCHCAFPVTMRTAPVATLLTTAPVGEAPWFGAARTGSGSSISGSHYATVAATLLISGFSGLTVNDRACIRGQYLSFNAEL